MHRGFDKWKRRSIIDMKSAVPLLIEGDYAGSV